MDATASLLELEHAGWSALCDGTAAEFYGERMTADGVMVLADGSVMDREQVVTSLGDAPTWDRYDIADPRTVDIADGVVALVYRGTGHRGDTTFVGAMSSTYVSVDDTWRLALYQQTPAT